MSANGSDGYDIPIEVLRGQIQKARADMAEFGDAFVKLALTFESCAKNVRDCSLRSDRIMFQPFFDTIFRRPCIQILGSKDEKQVYEVTGIDGGGIFLKRYGDLTGKEFHIDVTARPDMAARIRRAKPPEYVRPPANYAPISSSPSSYSSPSSPPPMPVADASDIPPSATEEEPPAEEPALPSNESA